MEGCGGRTRIEALLADWQPHVGKDVVVAGWAKSVRKQGSQLFFIDLSDGSSAKPFQIVVTCNALSEDVVDGMKRSGVSTCFRICGRIVESPKQGQEVEMCVDDKDSHYVRILGSCDQSAYPLAKKAHSREYLREFQHLRPRTGLISVIARIRSALALATHEFFQDRGFQYIHTPIITASDCEGAGEMFQVTTILPDSDKVSELLDFTTTAKEASAPVDTQELLERKLVYSKDFFGRKAFLTVSGQLDVEGYCAALSDVYTFGPTFRAELSHTSRHLAEFWMIEPEIAFAELEDNMRVAESYLRYAVQYILIRHRSDIEWLQENVEEGLISRLENIVNSKFARISYTEAIEELKRCTTRTFTKDPYWGFDMGSEHERYLAEELFKKPVIVYDYPADIKAFYMKGNEDGKTVRAMDILVPKIGEVVGGSQREDNLEKLEARIAAMGLSVKDYDRYLDLRRFGTFPHSGFGVGFERLLMMITGVDNIKDVIPFPRFPGNADF